MNAVRRWLLQVRALFGRMRAEDELTAELEAHIQLHIDDQVRAGLDPDDARRTALLKLGSIEAIRNAYSDQVRWRWMAGAARDFRFGLKSLRRQPGFAVLATATLALGIGANAAVFGVVDAVLLRPLPYSRPDRIVEIVGPGQGFVRLGPFDVSPPALRNDPAFTAMGVYVPGSATLGGDPAKRVPAAAVTPAFFDVLGVSPALGRTFRDEDVATLGRIVVLSDRTWREQFGADATIVGRPITIDAVSFTVLGVMPPRVSFPSGAQLWVPTNAGTGVMGQIPVATLVARLRDDVRAATIRDRVIAAAGVKSGAAAQVQVLPLADALAGGVRPIAALVWMGAALVLLVACSNTANLLLARASRRHREFAVRRALGATHGQLLRQLLIEATILAAIGALVALPAAWWTLGAARALLPESLHGVADIGLDGRVLASMSILAALVAVASAFGPALSIRGAGQMGAARFGVGLTSDRVWRRFRSILIVGQIAVVVVLQAASTVLVQAMRDVMAVDIGARGERAVVVEVTLPRIRYRSPAALRSLSARVDQAVRILPGVEEVGISNQLPGRAPALLLVRPIAVTGRRVGGRAAALSLNASPGFFRASGIDLLAGRTFSEADQPGAAPVAIVSEGFARALGVSPAELIGTHLASGNADSPREAIVGVVRDVRIHGPAGAFAPAVYVPYAVDPQWVGQTFIVVRTKGDPDALIAEIRSALARIDADLPLGNIRTFDQIRAALFAERRLAMLTMVVFAGLALALSAIGVYGVLNFLVEQRTREIGIRLAIGASRWLVCRDVLATGAAHAAIGAATGAAAALAGSAVAASRLEQATRLTPALLATLTCATAAIAMMASLIPAWRATRIDPVRSLRAE